MKAVPVFCERVTNGSWTCVTCGGELGAQVSFDGPRVHLSEDCPRKGECALLTLQLLFSLYDPQPGVC